MKPKSKALKGMLVKGLLESKYAYFGLIALVFLVSFVFQLLTRANFDMTWLAFGTARMLEGATLYHDVLEPNPPLIFWLYAFPVWLAGIVSVPTAAMLKPVFLVAIAPILFICSLILRQSSSALGKQRHSFLIAIAAILLLADNYMIFAQREHLLVVFSLPYVLLHLPSVSRRNLSPALQMVVGMLAALGFCLKPHFFVIPIAIVFCRVLQTKTLWPVIGRAEIMIALVTVLYSVAVWIFTPQYFDWVRLIAPLYGSHRAFNTTLWDTGWIFLGLAILGFVLAAGFGLFRREAIPSVQQEKWYLAAVTAGAYVEALLQFKLWEYISYPFTAFGILFIAAMVLLRSIGHVAAIAVLGLFFFTPTPWSDPRQEKVHLSYEDLSLTLADYREAKDTYFLALNFMPIEFYRLEPPLEWKNRIHAFANFLPGILEPNPVSGQPGITVKPGKEAAERWMLDTMIDNIQEKNPQLIIVMRSWLEGEGRENAFDFVAWMQKDPKFAQILRKYTLDKQDTFSYNSASSYKEYRVFVRNKSL